MKLAKFVELIIINYKMQNKDGWKQKFEHYFSKMELMGVRAANRTHRYFINFILLFIGWNVYSFSVNYNNYWRLRRDPNLPR
jgi:hypothetical protein